MKVKFFSIIVVLLLSGCFSVGEDYVKPEPYQQKPAWNGLDAHLPEIDVSHERPKDNWWYHFADPVLSNLVEKSLTFNHDIRVGEATVREAAALHGVELGKLFPQFSAQGALTRQKLGAISGEGLDRTSDLGIRGDWDLDLFGGNKRKKEAALATIERIEARVQAVRIKVAADVAKQYIKLRQAQKQRVLIISNMEVQQETLQGTIEKRKFGSATELEVTRAMAQLEETTLRLVQTNADFDSAINTLHLLTGERIELLKSLALQPGNIPRVKDNMLVSTPIQVVAFHPDIKVAERDLASKTALTGAALAEMFPKISLSGLFSVSESNLFGGTTPWNASGNLLAPVFRFGTLKSQMKAADARQQAAFENYQKTVLTTLEKIENAFVAYRNEKHRLAGLASIRQKREDGVVLAKEQYTAGITTQLELLEAQEKQLEAEDEYVKAETRLAENAVKLYEAFGMLD